MKHVLLSALVVLGAVMSGCARTASSGPETTPESIPVLATTTPQLRTGGDLGARHQRIVAEASRGGYEMAFLGASIIEGWPTTGKERWEKVWAPQRAVNCGIGGDRTQHVLGRLDDRLLDALAGENNSIRWVVMNVGANNTDSDSGADIATGIEAIVSRLRSRMPGVKVVLSMLPRDQWPGPRRTKIDEAVEALRQRIAAGKLGDVTLLDLRPRFLTEAGEVRGDLMPDHLHPSAEGYRVWSDELEKIIRPG